MPDFELHLGSDDLHSLLGSDSDLSFGHGFSEDEAEIEKAIEEELGRPRPRRRNRISKR